MERNSHTIESEQTECDRIRVLLIEDEPSYAKLIQRVLERKKNVCVDLVWADNLASGIRFLEGEAMSRGDACDRQAAPSGPICDFQVALLDLTLPDSQGLDTLRRVLAKCKDVPIIVLTGLDDEEKSIQALQEGAQDYLVKGQNEQTFLFRAMRYAIERKRTEERLKAARIEEERLKVLLQMAGATAHEMNQPLMVLLNNIELMKLHMNKPEKMDRFMTRVYEAGRRISSIVKSIQEIQDAKRYETKPYLENMSIIKLD